MRTQATNFLWVGSHSGLDLVNTEAVDDRGDPVDLVPDFHALVDWAYAAELIDADVARTVPGRIRIPAAPASRLVPDASCVPSRASRARRRRTVRQPGVGCGGQRYPRATAATTPTRPPMVHRSSPIGRSTDSASPSPSPHSTSPVSTAHVSARCAHRRCILLYYDTTKNRSRRWCDMATCGNRAKASAHHHRTRSA